MAHAGFRIIAIIEWDGAVYNKNGVDIEALMKHRKETGSIIDFPEAEKYDRNEAMFLPSAMSWCLLQKRTSSPPTMQTGCNAAFSPKAPTGPQRRLPTQSSRTRRYS